MQSDALDCKRVSVCLFEKAASSSAGQSHVRVLQCAAASCSMMQSDALGCSGLQSVSARMPPYMVLGSAGKSATVMQHVTVLQCVAVCSSVMQCAAVCFSVLQCVSVFCTVS